MKPIKKIIFLILIIFFFAGCSEKKQEIKTGNIKNEVSYLDCFDCNLIIISLTNTRKDHLGVYGYDRETSPNIDEFFKNAIIFNSAFAPSPWSFVNGLSMFNSIFPYKHKIMERDQVDLSVVNKYFSLAELLRQNSYKTAAFVSGNDYSSRYGLDQGFDLYVDEKEYFNYNIKQIPGLYDVGMSQLVPPAVEWLEKNNENKFFLFIQGFDTHCPYTPRAEYEKMFGSAYNGEIDYESCYITLDKVEPIIDKGKKKWPLIEWKNFNTNINIEENKKLFEIDDIEKMKSLYDGEIAQADNELIALFKAIENFDLDKNTVIVFLSEHGELFGEKGFFMKATIGAEESTLDELLNFPLLIKHPGISEKTKVDNLIQTVDIMPSILQILKIKDEQKDYRQGKSFVSTILDKQDINDYVYSGIERGFDARVNSENDTLYVSESIRSKEWRLVKEVRRKKESEEENYWLFNINNEKENLYFKKNEISSELSMKLKTWSEEVKR